MGSKIKERKRARGRLDKLNKASENTLSKKLAGLLGLLEGTAHSACDYSAEALRDRMKYMVAFITDDKKGMEKWEKFGDLCHKEREEQQVLEAESPDSNNGS